VIDRVFGGVSAGDVIRAVSSDISGRDSSLGAAGAKCTLHAAHLQWRLDARVGSSDHAEAVGVCRQQANRVSSVRARLGLHIHVHHLLD
jgi:hypothetical protein